VASLALDLPIGPGRKTGRVWFTSLETPVTPTDGTGKPNLATVFGWRRNHRPVTPVDASGYPLMLEKLITDLCLTVGRFSGQGITLTSTVSLPDSVM